MRKFMTILGLLALGALTASAGGGLGVFGSYYNGKDVEKGVGGGVKLSGDLVDYLSIELRGSYIRDFKVKDGGDGTTDEDIEDMTLIPLEVGLVANLPLGEVVKLYGGGGGGYYIIPEFESQTPIDATGSVRPQIDPEDKVGYYAVGGVQLNLSAHLAIFAEAKYTWLKFDEAKVDGVKVDADMDFTGLGGNAGLMVRF